MPTSSRRSAASSASRIVPAAAIVQRSPNFAWLERLVDLHFGSGQPARTVPPPADAPDALSSLSPLTAKPVLFVANVDEGSDEVSEDRWRLRGLAVGAVASSRSRRASNRSSRGARSRPIAAAMREELAAVGEAGPRARGRGAPSTLLELIAFFTAGEDKPGQSWHLRRGLTAWHAAGEIHSDIQRGFVRAEVVGWRELLDAGGYAGARERGVLRIEKGATT